jgi:hypothetical protein
VPSTLLQQLCLEQRLPERGWHREEINSTLAIFPATS